MIGSDFEFMVAFAIDQADRLPVRQRVRVLRGAALASSTGAGANELLRLANDLEEADRRCREFAFRINPETPPAQEP